MKISALNSPYSFKGATININAFSDVHGHIEKTDNAYRTMVKNRALLKNERGKINFVINGGDWFISRGNIGFKDQKNKSFTDFQILMYNKFLEVIKKAYPNTKTVFIPGSHEFDGGEQLFNRFLKETDTRFISANLDFSKRPTTTSSDTSDILTNSTIDFVYDDKNPDISYPILNVGISPLNRSTHNISSKTSQPQKINEKHYYFTIQAVKETIDKFKEEYPKGIVIATCHTGSEFARTLAKEADIDVVFNAHEHNANSEKIGKTQIINLSKDFDKISNVRLKLNDKGKITSIKVKELSQIKENFKHTNEIGRYFKQLFGKDIKKTHTLICLNKNIESLNMDGIKSGNNNLANFIVDVILQQIRKFDNDIDIFALNSSAIKGGFELQEGKNASNVEILNCLTGLTNEQGEIYTSRITGVELVEFILSNFLSNMSDENENPIMHYAGIKIDKTGMINDYLAGKNFEDLCKYIFLKKTKSTISPKTTYKLANTRKHFQKTEDETSNIILGRAHSTNHKIHDLFQDYFDENEPVIFNTENRIY